MKTWRNFVLFQITAVLVGTSAFPATIAEPDWLSKPGFRAILGSIQDQSFVYIESREDGLIFRHCEDSDQPDVIAGDKMPNTCPTFLNNDGIAVPPDLLMNSALGLKRIILTGGKIAVGGGVVVLQSLSWGIASEGAVAVNTVLPANPIQEYEDLHRAQRVIKDMVKYGNQSNDKQDGQIVTELLQEPYDQIKDGVTEELLGVVKQMMKRDKNIDEKWKQAYHTLMNQRYAQLLKKQDAAKTAVPGAAPAAPATGPSDDKAASADTDDKSN